MKQFNSKVDGLLAVALATAVAGPLVPIILEPAPERAEFWIMIAICLLLAGFILWLYQGTYYRVDGNQLHVHSGPFSWQIRISEIESVTPSRTLLSGPALSLDRLLIRYSGGKQLVISPADKAGFLAAVKQ